MYLPKSYFFRQDFKLKSIKNSFNFMSANLQWKPAPVQSFMSDFLGNNGGRKFDVMLGKIEEKN